MRSWRHYSSGSSIFLGRRASAGSISGGKHGRRAAKDGCLPKLYIEGLYGAKIFDPQGCDSHGTTVTLLYSVSKPLLLPNFSVRLFSVTVRTTLSGAPVGICASISRVTRTDDPT